MYCIISKQLCKIDIVSSNAQTLSAVVMQTKKNKNKHLELRIMYLKLSIKNTAKNATIIHVMLQN